MIVNQKHQEVRDLVSAVRSHDDATVSLQAAIDALAERVRPENLALSMTLAARELMADKGLMDTFTLHLYSGLLERGKTDSARWFGGKIFAWFSSAMVGFGLFLIWEFGLRK